MTDIRRLLTSGLMIFCLLAPVSVRSAEDCAEQLASLEQQNQQLHRQLREVKRELARQQSKADDPGWPQVAGGLGIIFGLCGIGMMLSARKQTGSRQ